MNRLFAGLGLVLIVVAALSATAIVLGRSLPVSPEVAMLHLADCKAPCWIGILPGQTTIREAKARLAETYGAGDRFEITPSHLYPDNAFDIIDRARRLSFQIRISFWPFPYDQQTGDPIVQEVILELVTAPGQRVPHGRPSGPSVAELFGSLPMPKSIGGGRGLPSMLRNDEFNTQIVVNDLNAGWNCAQMTISHPVWTLSFESILERPRNLRLKPWRGFRACYDLSPTAN